MGYGAFVTITNETSQPVNISIPAQSCMYDNGEENSWLSYFNNITTQPGINYPDTPNGVYIEASGLGSCGSQPSTFTMGVEGYGDIDFTESEESYSCTAPPGVSVWIANQKPEAKIIILILAQQ